MDKPVEIPQPPAAEQRPYSYERHGVTIEDPWHWLRDPRYPEVADPDVLAYLHAENDYFQAWKQQHDALIDQLFEEMKGRIKEDDSSVAIRDGDFLYWWAFRPGAEYRTWYRKPVGGSGQPVWTSDSGGIVFNEVNDNWRSYRARYHRLGQPTDEDITLYEETEELGFSVGIGRSQDRSLIFISTGDNATSEVRFVRADDPAQPLTLISP